MSGWRSAVPTCRLPALLTLPRFPPLPALIGAAEAPFEVREIVDVSPVTPSADTACGSNLAHPHTRVRWHDDERSVQRLTRRRSALDAGILQWGYPVSSGSPYGLWA